MDCNVDVHGGLLHIKPMRSSNIYAMYNIYIYIYIYIYMRGSGLLSKGGGLGLSFGPWALVDPSLGPFVGPSLESLDPQVPEMKDEGPFVKTYCRSGGCRFFKGYLTKAQTRSSHIYIYIYMAVSILFVCQNVPPRKVCLRGQASESSQASEASPRH